VNERFAITFDVYRITNQRQEELLQEACTLGRFDMPAHVRDRAIQYLRGCGHFYYVTEQGVVFLLKANSRVLTLEQIERDHDRPLRFIVVKSAINPNPDRFGVAPEGYQTYRVTCATTEPPIDTFIHAPSFNRAKAIVRSLFAGATFSDEDTGGRYVIKVLRDPTNRRSEENFDYHCRTMAEARDYAKSVARLCGPNARVVEVRLAE
jgi:hypothetical protein